MMLMKLSPKEQFLFVHVTTKVEICLDTEENTSKKSHMVCPKTRLSASFASL